MKQVEELVEALEKKYSVSIDRLLELYTRNTPRDEMAETLGTKEWTIRTIMSALNLRGPKKFRQHDYSYFLSRFGDTSSVELVEELQEANESLDQLSKDLVAKEQQLNKARRELSKYRRAHGAPLDVSDIVRGLSKPTELPRAILKETNYSQHTQLVLLSDCHVEEVVSTSDVGASNEYNWSIMQERLSSVFSEALNSHRGERKIVVASLGDQFSGVIHDTLEHTGKPLGEAIAEFAQLLASYIRVLSSRYDEVYVPVVHGNHGRIGQHKKSAGYGADNFEYMMAQILKALVADLGNVTVDISTTGLITFDIGGKIVGGHHGDFFRSFGDVKFMRVKEHFRQVLGVEPDVILQGHTHVFNVEQMPRSGTYITNGSLIGPNGYSVSNGFVGKNWGQVLMTFLPNGLVENVRLVGN